jgi:hypothetical protein
MSKEGKDVRCREWDWVINNYTQEDIYTVQNMFEEKKAKHYCFGKEVGEKGTPHLQGCVYFPTVKSAQWISKQISKRITCRPRHNFSTYNLLIMYCKKGKQSHQEFVELHDKGPNYGLDADVIEWGEPPKQGERTDLKKITDSILKGENTIDTICRENPMVFHLYERTLKKASDLYEETLIRDWTTQGYWLYGPSGTGKSHLSEEAFGKSEYVKQYGLRDWYKFKCYIHNPRDKDWWDKYNHQDIVIFDEFRGELDYAYLLRLADKTFLDLPRRGRSPINFTSKIIIINSSLHPEKIYKRRDREDHIAQLWRRFKVYHIDKRYNELPAPLGIPRDVENILKNTLSELEFLELPLLKKVPKNEQKSANLVDLSDTYKCVMDI